jgi:ABC-type uncharacterized transport system substrate-binding protein
MAASGEPLATGVIGGLARPGGNVTGFSTFTNELIAKRIELLSGVKPGLARIAFLQDMSNPISQSQWEVFKSSTQMFRVEPVLLDLRRSEDLASLFDAIAPRKIDALVVGNDTVTHASRKQIVLGASQEKVPAIYATREFVDDGGLMAYAVNYADLYRRTGPYVDIILEGAKPGDLQVEQPEKFEFVINEDRSCDWPHHSTNNPRPRRRGDRIGTSSPIGPYQTSSGCLGRLRRLSRPRSRSTGIGGRSSLAIIRLAKPGLSNP